MTLRTRDNLSLPLSTRPAQVRLAPGDAAEVTVKARVGSDLSESQRHHLHLEARAQGGAEVSSLAAATVELIPRSLSAAASYHHLPLRLRLGETLSRTSSAAAVVGGPNLSVSGGGQLWDEDPGRLDLQLGVGPGGKNPQNLISYETSGFRVAAGEQSFSLAPLPASRSGLGVSAQHDFALGSRDRL